MTSIKISANKCVSLIINGEWLPVQSALYYLHVGILHYFCATRMKHSGKAAHVFPAQCPSMFCHHLVPTCLDRMAKNTEDLVQIRIVAIFSLWVNTHVVCEHVLCICCEWTVDMKICLICVIIVLIVIYCYIKFHRLCFNLSWAPLCCPLSV